MLAKIAESTPLSMIYRVIKDEPIEEASFRKLSTDSGTTRNVYPPQDKYEEMTIAGEKAFVLENKKNKTDGKVFLIGTNHIYKNSRQAVIQLIKQVKPHLVVIELCHSRAGLTSSNLFQGRVRFNFLFLYRAMKELGPFPGMILFAMAYLEVFISRLSKTRYGSEMTAPSEHSDKDFQIIYGDRPNEVTLKRMAMALNFGEKALIFANTFLAVCLGLRCFLLMIPGILFGSRDFVKVLVYERDVYLTYSMQNAVEQSFIEPTRVVGIVGMGHVPGILRLWGNVSNEDVDKIMKT